MVWTDTELPAGKSARNFVPCSIRLVCSGEVLWNWLVIWAVNWPEELTTGMGAVVPLTVNPTLAGTATDRIAEPSVFLTRGISAAAELLDVVTVGMVMVWNWVPFGSVVVTVVTGTPSTIVA